MAVNDVINVINRLFLTLFTAHLAA